MQRVLAHAHSTWSYDGRLSLEQWVAIARELGSDFGSRAAAYDANDSFVLENVRQLKERHVFSAPVPAERVSCRAVGPTSSRKAISAAGLRAMFPVQTNRIFTGRPRARRRPAAAAGSAGCRDGGPARG